MHLSPDNIVFWQHGFLKINATVAITWGLMFVLTVGSYLITRNLSTGLKISRWQNLLEIIVATVRKQIEEVGLHRPERYLGFLGTLFLFIAFSNLCTIFPGYEPPTGSLSTTAALAICVFIAVPIFGITQSGLRGYLATYLKPTFLMLPFNIISETLAHPGAGGASFRKHHEWHHDPCHSGNHHAVNLSHLHDCARSPHGDGASLYLQHFGHGLYRRGHPNG